MASFRGSFSRPIDVKGRLTLSKQFRRVTGVKEKGGAHPFLVLTKGWNDSLWAFPEDEWPNLEQRLRQGQRKRDEGQHSVILEMMRHMEDVGIDALGRILIPQSLLEVVGLEKGKECLAVGVLDHIELWNPERYDEYIAAAREKDGSFDDRLAALFRD